MARALGESDIRAMAEKIARDHKAGKLASLHAGTVKTAIDEALNPEQGDRLSEAVNHANYQLALPERGDGDIRFDKVDPKAVRRELNAPKLIVDPKPIDYTQPPPKVAMDITKMSAIPQEILDTEAMMDKVAADTGLPPGVTPDKIRHLMGKLATVKEEYSVESAGLSVKLAVEVSNFTEIVRQYIMAGETPEEILKTAFDGRPLHHDLLCDLFGETLSKLGARGYIPGVKMGTALPPEAISKRLQEFSPKIEVRLINGSHPLLKAVDTIAGAKERKELAERSKALADDKVGKLKKVLIQISTMRSRPARVGNQHSGANRS